MILRDKTKKIITRLLNEVFILVTVLTVFSFFITYDAGAQEITPVQKSDNKVIIEGKIYFLHIVKAGQTAFSISRAYGLKETDLEKENPGVLSGIKIGQVLKIPVSIEPVAPEQPKKDTSEYIEHVFQKDETLYSLSKRYNVSFDDIEKANPGIEPTTLKEGQVIYFPKLYQHEPDTEYISHRVRRRETLYSISRKYDISIVELKEHNPELFTSTLRTGQILTIPVIREIIDIQPPEEEEKEEEVVVVEEEEAPLEIDEVIDSLAITPKPDIADLEIFKIYEDIPEMEWKRSIDVAMLIPFNYEETPDTLSPSDSETGRGANIQADPASLKPASLNFLEFLEGSLLALDSLKKRGVSVNLKVFDTRRSPSHIRSIIASGELNKMDLIIGPFFLYNAEIVSALSLRSRIPMIIPFLDSDSLLNSNPYLFQLNPSPITELYGMAEYLSKQRDYNIILFYSVENNEPKRARYIRNSLVNEYFQQGLFMVPEIKELAYDPAEKTDLSASLTNLLSLDKPNMVIVPSSNEAFVYTAVTQLFFQLGNYKIELFGMPEWSVFHNVDLMYLHQLNLRYLAPYHFSYDDSGVQDFLRRWRKEFSMEPVSFTSKGCNYAFLGFDITWYFLNAYHQYGRRFFLHTDKLTFDLLMNPFHFRKSSYAAGFENTFLKIVQYTPDFNIIYEDFNSPGKIQPTPKDDIILETVPDYD